MSAGIPLIELSPLHITRLVFQHHVYLVLIENGQTLVSQSIITEMKFFFGVEKDNPLTKSIEIESHFQVGISKGLSSPTGH